MPSRRKQSVTNTEHLTNKKFHEVENKHNDTIDRATDQEQVIQQINEKALALETNKDNVITSKRKAGRLICSWNICRSSTSTRVNTQSSSDNDHNDNGINGIAANVSKTNDNNTKDDLQNEGRSSPVYSIDHEKTKSPSVEDTSTTGMVPTRRSSTDTTFMHQTAAVKNVKAGLGNRKKPKQKKIRKKSLNTEEDIQLVYINQMASLSTAIPEMSSLSVPALDSQPTVEDESDLLENAEQERRRNKERVRVKNMIQNKYLSPKVMNKLDIAYLNAQREIDKVLEPQSLKIKSPDRDTVTMRKDNIEINGEDNELYKGDEKDSLEKAREKMHKLLDDAFDVISQRQTNVTNNVQPSSEIRSEANSFNTQKNHLARIEQTVQTDESMLSHKLHTPMQVHHSFAINDPEGLITWNPYGAYDDTTRISVNNAETNMSNTSEQQENMRTSIFDQPFRSQSKYFATGPGEPIVIKTRNLEQDIPQNITQRKISKAKQARRSDINENLPPYIKSRNQGALQNPAFNSLIPDKSEDIYLNNFYELSCFQETPTTSQMINAETMNSTHPDSYSNPSENTDRTAFAYASYTKGHIEPNRSLDKNYDMVDVIKESLQPGISPQPLIDSLRKELQILSNKSQGTTKKANTETN